MSGRTIYFDSETPCPTCQHAKGWHGFDTAGCSAKDDETFCLCNDIFVHRATPNDDDMTTCRVCNVDIDLQFVHAYPEEGAEG